MTEFVEVLELHDLWNALPEFEQKLAKVAAELSLSLTDYQIDHISVRCHHIETAQRWQTGLLKCAQLLSENEINGRPICLFELNRPLVIAAQEVSVVELPFPKDKRYAQESWEHIELVMNVAPEQLESAALALLPQPLPEGYSVKMSQPKGQSESLPNPTLAVTNGEITVKYHPYTLKQVIESEK
ncbi:MULTISPECIES: VOC family protein [Providencia]|uniref:VOC family protein n=1 Tax=Providencia TaxID=586 RepID=UPI0018C6B57D|nr:MULTISPECIES: VOC family protein [Providencia]MBG5918195.1 VOC family protein [Providencia stuartii]